MAMTAHTSDRRRALLLAVGAGLCGCASAPLPAAAHDERVADAIAPGVHVMTGARGAVTPANRGRIGNAGFIVGPRGVIAVDAGTSHADGAALLRAIERVTALPVRLLVITSPHQEFLFGAMAFRERGIPIAMQRDAARLMASRCTICLKNLNDTLGAAEMRGTAMFTPDRLLDASTRLDDIGRPVQVLHFGHSSGPGDIAVMDDTSQVLFAGGLLDQQHIPDVLDADTDGWRRALQSLRALPLSRVVPGHGPVSTPALIDTVGRYLDQLEVRARQMVETGVSLRDAPDLLQLPEFAGWDRYDTTHRRNASIAYLRFERELLLR